MENAKSLEREIELFVKEFSASGMEDVMEFQQGRTGVFSPRFSIFVNDLVTKLNAINWTASTDVNYDVATNMCWELFKIKKKNLVKREKKKEKKNQSSAVTTESAPPPPPSPAPSPSSSAPRRPRRSRFNKAESEADKYQRDLAAVNNQLKNTGL